MNKGHRTNMSRHITNLDHLSWFPAGKLRQALGHPANRHPGGFRTGMQKVLKFDQIFDEKFIVEEFLKIALTFKFRLNIKLASSEAILEHMS